MKITTRVASKKLRTALRCHSTWRNLPPPDVLGSPDAPLLPPSAVTAAASSRTWDDDPDAAASSWSVAGCRRFCTVWPQISQERLPRTLNHSSAHGRWQSARSCLQAHPSSIGSPVTGAYRSTWQTRHILSQSTSACALLVLSASEWIFPLTVVRPISMSGSKPCGSIFFCSCNFLGCEGSLTDRPASGSGPSAALVSASDKIWSTLAGYNVPAAPILPAGGLWSTLLPRRSATLAAIVLELSSLFPSCCPAYCKPVLEYSGSPGAGVLETPSAGSTSPRLRLQLLPDEPDSTKWLKSILVVPPASSCGCRPCSRKGALGEACIGPISSWCGVAASAMKWLRHYVMYPALVRSLTCELFWDSSFDHCIISDRPACKKNGKQNSATVYSLTVSTVVFLLHKLDEAAAQADTQSFLNIFNSLTS